MSQKYSFDFCVSRYILESAISQKAESEDFKFRLRKDRFILKKKYPSTGSEFIFYGTITGKDEHLHINGNVGVSRWYCISVSLVLGLMYGLTAHGIIKNAGVAALLPRLALPLLAGVGAVIFLVMINWLRKLMYSEQIADLVGFLSEIERIYDVAGLVENLPS
jgi:hypothetical protein